METEVLAPAGSIEGLKAALYAGADAVYTGGRMFGARAYANNLSDEELSECIDYCHLHNKKMYLTTNTLMKQSEIYQLADWLVPFYEQGLDAVIVQDFGAFAFLKRECYTVRRTFVNAFFFCAQKTGFFHHEQAQECVLAKKEKGGFT